MGGEGKGSHIRWSVEELGIRLEIGFETEKKLKIYSFAKYLPSILNCHHLELEDIRSHHSVI